MSDFIGFLFTPTKTNKQMSDFLFQKMKAALFLVFALIYTDTLTSSI